MYLRMTWFCKMHIFTIIHWDRSPSIWLKWTMNQGKQYVQFNSVQSLSCVWPSVTPRTAAHQASLSTTNSWNLLKLMPTESVMPFNHLILFCPLLLLSSIFPSIRVLFPMSQFFASGGQSTGVPASASVLPKNIQDWSPLGWTGWISLKSKGLSRLSSPTPQFKNIIYLALSFLYSPTLTSIHDYWKNHSFDKMDICWQRNVSAF